MKKYFTIVCLLILAASHGQGLVKSGTSELGRFKSYSFTSTKIEKDSASYQLMYITSKSLSVSGYFYIYEEEIEDFIENMKTILDSVKNGQKVHLTSYEYSTKKGARVSATYYNKGLMKGWNIGFGNVYEHTRANKGTPMWVKQKDFEDFVSVFIDASKKIITQ